MAHFSGESSRKSLPGNLYQNRDKTSGLYAHDIIIVGSDDGEVPAHKIILGSESNYFENVINQNLELSSTLPIRLEERDYTKEILETLIKYIYLPENEVDLVDITQMSKLLEAADKFDIPEFKKKYLRKLNKNVTNSITENNWSLFFTEGVKLNESEAFFKPIYNFMKGFNFIATDEFLNLTIDEFRTMLKSSNRPFDSKDSLMKATLKWVGRNGSEYSDELIELWGIFDTPSPTKKSARSNSTSSKSESVSGRPTRDSTAKNKREVPTPSTRKGRGVRGRGRGIQLATRGARKSAPATGAVQRPESEEEDHNSSDEENDSENGNENKKIKLERNVDADIPIACQDQDIGSDSSDLEIIEEIQTQSTKRLLFFGRFKKSNCLLSYNIESKETLQAAVMPTNNLKDPSLIAVEDRIYCLGGTIGDKRQDLVKSFAIEELCDENHLNKAWDKEKSKLYSGRCLFPSLLFNNTIYMFGGCDGSSVSNAIEKWDLKNKNKGWVDNVFHMEYARERFSVVMHDNTVYLVGGRGTPTFKKGTLDPLSTAEFFAFGKKRIERLPSLNETRADVRVVIVKEKLYAIGGIVNLAKNKKVSSIETLNTSNISKGWKMGKSMTTPRANGWAFVLNEKIYYVGGNDGKKPTMEMYNPKLDTWQIVDSDLPEGADFSTCVLLL